MINYVPLYLDELIFVFVFGENSEVGKMPSDYPTPTPTPPAPLIIVISNQTNQSFFPMLTEICLSSQSVSLCCYHCKMEVHKTTVNTSN